MSGKRGRPAAAQIAALPGPCDTPDRLLDAAEALFAERGFRGVSLRAINEAAGARNTSAAHYHFGSKEALVDAVFARRMGVLNRSRMERLAAIPSYPSGDPTPIPAAIRAVLDPTAQLLLDDTGHGQNYLRILVRAAVDPAIGLPRLATASYQDVSRRFHSIIGRALPDLPPNVIAFRMRLGLEVGIHGLADIQRILRRPDRSIDPAALEILLQHLTDYLVGGLAAPMSAAVRDAGQRRRARRGRAAPPPVATAH